MDEELSGKRKEIYDYIQEHPGSHLREMARNLDLAIGEIQYHLDVLEKKGYIVSKRMGLYKRFYPSKMFGERQKEIMGILSQETPRKILLFLLHKPGASHREIAEFARLSAPTVTWHMKRLADIGLVEAKREGRSVKYYIKGSATDIEKIMKSYYPTFWERWADRFAEMWLDLSAYKEKEMQEDD
ncbi:MAG TPA: winged helix-turn-helix transcriptional regulator [Fervidicoccus fontis]|uniref:Winged helix-turn-helix transcriptional regulator n=1 Tax=Fervidicoccus fontis TaxID=683846 RepID=A0A7C2UTS7_9CREN|nr:MAG: transcriptional regulator [Fervidicoccus sp.]HEU97363.1 winged helix-turn-helix transcriptional regulator [Fervidicoccus fontis]